MDVLADLLDGVRARGALFRRTVMTPPWSLRFASGAPLTLATMLRGAAWVVPAGGEPVRVAAGDVVVLRGRAPYTVASDPALAPRAVIGDWAYCATGDGGADDEADGSAVADGPAGSALLLSGAFTGRGVISERLLRALPDLLVTRDADCPCPMLDAVAEEVTGRRPGQRVVLDRLLDLTLVSTLRSWFDRSGARAPAWYRAMDDPVVGRALRLLHDAPAHPWTVAELATGSGVSRAALARRFTERVGEPPMAYLTSWRIAMAADLLRGTDATVGSIARQVGYANAFALSVAFKRLRGMAPTAYRAPGAEDGAGPGR
jgi:AraC-like DNA-binding protein